MIHPGSLPFVAPLKNKIHIIKRTKTVVSYMNSQFIEVITNIVVFSPFIDNFIATLLISSIVVLHDKNTILLVMITAI